MEITFKFDDLEEAKKVFDFLSEGDESTNDKIDRKMKEEKSKKKTKKTTKKKKKEEVEEESALSIDDVKAALKQHAEMCGKKNTSKILKKFAPKVSELEEDQYAELIAKLVEDTEDEDFE